MDAELQQNIRTRGALKSKLTLFSNYLNNTVDKVNSGTDEEDIRASVIEVSERLNKMDSLLTEFDTIQLIIDSKHENEKEQFKEREMFENSYYKAITQAKRFLANRNIIRNDHSLNSNNSNGLSTSVNHIKLPQIHLPKFKGTYEDWLGFRDTFQSLIHANDEIGEIQKFHYLRAALEGSAAHIVSAIQFSADNYSVAWELLCQRYDNKPLLIHNHVKALFNLPSIATESASDIRHLIDNLTKHLRSLQILEQPTSQWDILIIYIVTSKLDQFTAREWEETKKGNKIPTLNELKDFLRSRADLLETLQAGKVGTKHLKEKLNKTHSFNTLNENCKFCKGTHAIYNCRKFLDLSVKDRIDNAKKCRLCINCLRDGHIAKDCRSGKCRKCNSQHNTLLHLEREFGDATQVMSNSTSNSTSAVIIATALIQVFDVNGYPITCRAILDSASQSNFISLKTSKQLALPTTNTHTTVMGIDRSRSTVHHQCTLKLQSIHNAFETTVSALVVQNISDILPSQTFKFDLKNIPSHIKLADPRFNESGEIDMLLGAGIFWQLLCIGQHKISNDLMLQKTRFGWIVTGAIKGQFTTQSYCNLTKTIDIQQQLERFWNIEENSTGKILSSEDIECEHIFKNTVRRHSDERFMVSIPLKESPSQLGDSRENALQRMHTLERKFRSKPEFKKQYVTFMNEYKQFNHMTLVDDNHKYEQSYYLPHHGIINENSTTTRLRVVFDGSAPSDSGVSLNDIQFVGPTIQEDLLSIILRFREHKYAVCADIQKMYRQIWINSDQRPLQMILWRSSEDEPIKTYALNTVTYGTTSAPYLAIRCLKQLAIENKSIFPDASGIIESDFYVDDLITGGESLETLQHNLNDIIIILKSAGFELHKWSSNSERLLQAINSDTTRCQVQNFSDNQNTKTLGLYWSCVSDKLFFKIGSPHNGAVTKRTILSDIAQVFDPLGLLGPCIIIAKIILQTLWQHKVSWDESLPGDIHTKWETFRKQLPVLNHLQIPRYISEGDIDSMEIHGFSDASQEAYGACIYVRTTDKNGQLHIRLVCAKSRVAPVKIQTIPRLELCGALILAQLASKVKASFKRNINRSYFWTDSTVTLHWIKTHANLLQTFVGNRVSQIQHLTQPHEWHYISTKQNPADLLSRGVSPRELTTHQRWWFGPDWLKNDKQEWPTSFPDFNEEIPELKRTSVIHVATTTQPIINVEKFSNLKRLQRTMAYCIRFIRNCKSKLSRNIGSLQPDELSQAMDILVGLSQTKCFAEERKLLEKGGIIPNKSSLQSLSPFLDSKGLIRVGGRLQLADCIDSRKHPFILSGRDDLTKLIFRTQHVTLLHAGPQLLLSSIREIYWPIAGRNLARTTVRSCVKCFRAKPTQLNPLMGILPQSRVHPSLPFSMVGIDYAGPFTIKDRKGRGCKCLKCYICVFVCFSTKALHLELVTSLSSESFLLVLKRFIARRGRPHEIFSDNGRTFVGANAELLELFEFLRKNNDHISNRLSGDGIKWHFMPPYAPHFGGLWEAGVKSVKYHLKRVLNKTTLTFEEFCTVLSQIEAVLNSRPLTPLSSDPNDFLALTPSHFLIGRSLTGIPEPKITHIPENKLTTFQYLQQLQQHFWSRWTKEYLSELQQKQKWKTNQSSLKINDLVLIKEDNSPPLAWKLGRILELFPGPDGISRVASIRTSTSVVKRAFSKLCPLPVDTQGTN